MNKQRLLYFLKYAVFVFCFAGIPVILSIEGYRYWKNTSYEKSIKKLSTEVFGFYTKLTPFADQQVFWCQLFNNRISEKAVKGNTLTETMFNIALLFKNLGENYDFEYLVYSPGEGMISNLSAGTLLGTNEEKQLALRNCWHYLIYGTYAHGNNEQVEKARGIVFGPQFYPPNMNVCKEDSPKPSLCWTDALFKRKPFWVSAKHGCLMMAFVKNESIINTNCIKAYLEEANSEMGYGIHFVVLDKNLGDDFPEEIDGFDKKVLEQALEDYEKNHSMRIETQDFILFPKYLRAGVVVLGIAKKSEIQNEEQFDYWLFLVVFTALLALCISVYAWKIFIGRELDSLSIKWKLGFMFFFSNGLPLLVLLFIGNEFVKQVRENYIQNIIKEGTAFLNDFDEKYELEFSNCAIKIKKLRNKIFTPERNSLMTFDELELFFNGISSDTAYCYFVASNSQVLVRNRDGAFDQRDLKNKTYEEMSVSERAKQSKRFDKATKTQICFAEKYGQFYLNQVNNTPVSEKTAAEIELLIEAILRKKLNYFVFDTLDKCGNFFTLGFGKRIDTSLMDTFSYGNHKGFDYFMIFTLRRADFQQHYLQHSIPSANRNELGMRVITWSTNYGFIPEFESDADLVALTKRLDSYPIKDTLIINHKGDDYIVMGFDCKHLIGNKLIGLYPLTLVDEYVEKRKNDIVLVGSLSVGLTLSLMWAIISAFLAPLSEITTGVRAIREKRFDHRLPDLGRDEFGSMGKIFNNMMVDFEELSVAATIQKQLLPSDSIKTGKFSLFGKNVTMVAMGGDYFDFIELGDNKFSVALGDVAGHGVGASLIMAMAKSGLILLEELWREPQKIVGRLHEMIYNSKTKDQRKIMTFQYLYVDGNTCEGVYSNAGGCSPIIIRKNAKVVEELYLQGAALGAFKRGKFSEIRVNFQPGDAIVFYTDGIVECKNKAGEMLGYDNLKLLFERCWNSDAKVFYDNIYQAYLDYIGSEENASDDQTVVVMVCQ